MKARLDQRQTRHAAADWNLFAFRARLDDGAGGEAAFFFGDGFGIDQPLAVAGATGLFVLLAGKAAEAEKAADFGAGRVHDDSGLLGREPVGAGHRHTGITLAASRMRCNSTDWDSYIL